MKSQHENCCILLMKFEILLERKHIYVHLLIRNTFDLKYLDNSSFFQYYLIPKYFMV